MSTETALRESSLRTDKELSGVLLQFDKYIRQIKKSQEIDTEAIKGLKTIFKNTDSNYIEKMLGDRLAKNKVGVIFKKYMREMEKSSPELQTLRELCCDCTHASHDIGKHFVRSGVLLILLSDLKLLIKANDMTSNTVDTILTIVYNCSKASEFEDTEVLKTILPFTKADNDTIKMLATLTISYIVNDENNNLISTDGSVIANIMRHLKDSVKTKNHASKGWSTLELVAGLKSLSSNDDNSANVVDQDIIPILLELIVSGNDKERKIASETLWMLTFHEKNKRIISENEDTMKTLKQVSREEGVGIRMNSYKFTSPTWSGLSISAAPKVKRESHMFPYLLTALNPAKQAALGILWLLAKKKEEASKSTKQHIMISYQWKSQDIMERVYEELTAQGYTVWIDIHQMRGSILEAMADAVENAEMILVCMTQKYKDSPNCRTEAEYAFSLRKKIIPLKLEEDYKADGWLGALVGTKMYINFSSSNQLFGKSFDKKIQTLIVEIENASHEKKKTAAPSTSDSYTIYKCIEDVKAWATKKNITSPKITDLNTKELQFLCDLRNKSPDVFFKYLNDQFGKKELLEMMNIYDAMTEL